MSSCMNDNFFQQPQTLGGEITTYTYVYNNESSMSEDRGEKKVSLEEL